MSPQVLDFLVSRQNNFLELTGAAREGPRVSPLHATPGTLVPNIFDKFSTIVQDNSLTAEEAEALNHGCPLFLSRILSRVRVCARAVRCPPHAVIPPCPYLRVRGTGQVLPLIAAPLLEDSAVSLRRLFPFKVEAAEVAVQASSGIRLTSSDLSAQQLAVMQASASLPQPFRVPIPVRAALCRRAAPVPHRACVWCRTSGVLPFRSSCPASAVGARSS